MFKKTLLALTAAAAIVGFGGLVQSTPAEAQARGPDHQWRHPGPGPRWDHRGPGHWDGRGHWGYRSYYRPGYRAYYPGYRAGFYFGAPGVYTGDCRLVQRRVRVLTDYGWRLRWRTQRVCY